MKAALTVWDNRISPVFDVSREALIIDVVHREVVHRESCVISASSALGKITWFLDKKVNALICGAISEALYREFIFNQMTVNGFIAGNVEDVIEALIKGSIDDEKFLMPGCRHHQKNRNQHRRNFR